VTCDLKERWKEIWRKLQVDTVPQVVFDELIRAYSSAERFYHNLTHIADCLSMFDLTKSLAAHPEEVELAIWFHDAVYDTRRDDNEQKSAEWAGKVIRQSGLGSGVVERVSGMILATRHNIEAVDTDAQLMADVDLSIFGAEAEPFWRYEENIRKEYAWVPESLFRRKRVEILQGFLSRPYIYYHTQYREALEEKARLNLQQAVAKLSI
jgi:predicted metal-dependent HD superfamily phosphohydrolase